MSNLGDRVSDVSNWAEDHFDIFRKRAKKKWDTWSEKIQDFEKKAEEKSKDKFKDEINYLNEKKTEMGHQLSELSEASGEAWEDIKKGVMETGSSIMDALKKGFKKM
jgi:4-alpha-glucanotransferase